MGPKSKVKGASYNGYSARERDGILTQYKHLVARNGYRLAATHCQMCGDPDCPPNSWHSEDYSQPYIFDPPATYVVCTVCHGRIHKRFNNAEEWKVYCQHLERGGYGREFTGRYSLGQRRQWIAEVALGQAAKLPHIRRRGADAPWWRDLTPDPESLDAAWARPRPLRPRPDARSFRQALLEIDASDKERSILSFHAVQSRRTVTMQQVATTLLGSNRATTANLAYGTLARRLALALNWSPDKRPDGSPVWMSMVAEGWQPRARQFEWVMVGSLVEAIDLTSHGR